jgi:hypothetical protein
MTERTQMMQAWADYLDGLRNNTAKSARCDEPEAHLPSVRSAHNEVTETPTPAVIR